MNRIPDINFPLTGGFRENKTITLHNTDLLTDVCRSPFYDLEYPFGRLDTSFNSLTKWEYNNIISMNRIFIETG